MAAKAHPAFDEFVETIASLRAPDGCPWDREQTHESIAPNMLEEAYEAVDAIEAGDSNHLREELGDVLLQVVLQSQIAQDNNEFTLDEVCQDINQKIIRRHPHVFGDAQAKDAEAVHELWDAVKRAERQAALDSAASTPEPTASTPKATAAIPEATASTLPATTTSQPPSPKLSQPGLLDQVPTGFPSLTQAQKISRKMVSAGFEWETLDDIWQQVFSEIDELKAAYAAAPKNEKGKLISSAEVELEMGDVLFSLVNIARRMGIDAESSLRVTCRKIRTRWAFMEVAATEQNSSLEDVSLDEKEALWQKAKENE